MRFCPVVTHLTFVNVFSIPNTYSIAFPYFLLSDENLGNAYSPFLTLFCRGNSIASHVRLYVNVRVNVYFRRKSTSVVSLGSLKLVRMQYL